jgi:hypothetical protein
LKEEAKILPWFQGQFWCTFKCSRSCLMPLLWCKSIWWHYPNDKIFSHLSSSDVSFKFIRNQVIDQVYQLFKVYIKFLNVFQVKNPEKNSDEGSGSSFLAGVLNPVLTFASNTSVPKKFCCVAVSTFLCLSVSVGLLSLSTRFLFWF